jgi:ribosomal protein L7Ae-like RNA K-turn-binding protein
MDNKLEYYILFPSYTYGLALEALLKKEKIKYTIVPTPRELTVSCGICIKYNKEDEEVIKGLVQNNSINIIGFYSLAKRYKKFYE